MPTTLNDALSEIESAGYTKISDNAETWDISNLRDEVWEHDGWGDTEVTLLGGKETMSVWGLKKDGAMESVPLFVAKKSRAEEEQSEEAQQSARAVAAVAAAETLEQLRDALKLPDPHESVDWTELPIYGGEEPRNTSEVWSWDEENLLVGLCADELEIVERGEWRAN